ncbi:Nucleotide-binding oligomerization domain-containing protein 1 [Liparis tanakae]|uniref:Nucleotide-binding oligomerization domain-containing protein 1 n=1 Tax=Liparis tanakae TaxID=230148 RepID=A0A4Z2ILD9_9TELE|nr:Nucleotide-binding oligomerization domain-containing protein 1 [Liparis tanakae]
MWGNSIGDDGAEAFAEALRHHPRLTNISLSANGITSKGGTHLAEALKENSILRIFWLINNQFTVAGIKRLATALTHNTALKEIWQPFVFIDQRGDPGLGRSDEKESCYDVEKSGCSFFNILIFFFFVFFFFFTLQGLQTQHRMHGEASKRSGDVTSTMMLTPTRIPTT